MSRIIQIVPFSSFKQFQAMMAAGGKSRETALRWKEKYGVPKKRKRRKRKSAKLPPRIH